MSARETTRPALRAMLEYLEHVGERVVVVVPDVRSDRRAIDDLTPMQHEKFEQREFLGGELDVQAAASDAPRREIHLEVRDVHDGRQERRPSPRECADACDQLAKCEGLRHVIVRADLEAGHAIVERISRGEHEDGCIDFTAAHFPAQVQSGTARQHHIQDNDVEARAQRLRAPAAEGGGAHDLYIVLAKSGLQDAGELGIILDQEEGHAAIYRSSDRARARRRPP